MKTQVSINDYSLKIETESMVVSIQLRKHEQAKEILQLTKDITQMAMDSGKKNEEPPAPPAAPVGRTIEGNLSECPVCGKQFKPRSKTTKYCSKKCGQKIYQQRYLEKQKKQEKEPIEKTLSEIEANRKKPYQISN